MAIGRVGFVSLPTAVAAGWTMTVPAAAVADDVVYTTISKSGNGAITTVPTGYVLLDTPVPEGASNNFTWWYAKVLTPGEGGTSHIWAWSSIGATCAALVLRGCDPAQVLDVPDPPAATLVNGLTSIATPTSTVSTSGAWVLWTVSTGTSGTQSFPATVDGNPVTRELGSASGRIGLAWATYPAAGAVAAATATLAPATRATAKTLVARPYVAPVPLVTQRWDGSAWQPVASVQRWDGSAWQPATVKRWNGTSWV